MAAPSLSSAPPFVYDWFSKNSIHKTAFEDLFSNSLCSIEEWHAILDSFKSMPMKQTVHVVPAIDSKPSFLQRAAQFASTIFRRTYPNRDGESTVKQNAPSHFSLWNDWEDDVEGPKFSDSKAPMYLKDMTTEDRYLNESKGVVRAKCLMILFGFITGIIPLFYALITVGYLFYNLFVTCKVDDIAEDVKRLATMPLSLPVFALISLYGLFNPYDARKLYASMEREVFNYHWAIAPCFQPSPTKHAFGGDLGKQNGF